MGCYGKYSLSFDSRSARVAGLMQVQLSESGGAQPVACPGTSVYADNGAPKLLEETCREGAIKDRLIVTIAGGAQPPNETTNVNWGKKNYLAVRKSLWKLGVLLQSDAVGGTAVRSVRLEVATGKCWLAEPDRCRLAELDRADPELVPELEGL